jgi:hypothetical protein
MDKTQYGSVKRYCRGTTPIRLLYTPKDYCPNASTSLGKLPASGCLMVNKETAIASFFLPMTSYIELCLLNLKIGEPALGTMRTNDH